MDRETNYVYVLTQLVINSDGRVTSRNLAVTCDVFEAEAHRATAVENDFERYQLPANWRESAEQSSFVSAMREFREIVLEMQRAALR